MRGHRPTACSDQDSCNGARTCLPNHFADTAACGDAGEECKNPDFCNGEGQCTDNGPVPDGSVCSENNPLTLDDRCNAGVCEGSVVTPVPAGSVPLRMALVAALLASGLMLRRVQLASTRQLGKRARHTSDSA